MGQIYTSFKVEAIPAELKAIAQWVCWRPEPRGDKVTKVPHDAKTGDHASVSDPSTWATFEQAVATAQHNNGILGIGFVLTADLGIVGLDFDHVYDPGTQQWLKHTDWIGRLNGVSYAEMSPSGTGVRAFIRAVLPSEPGGKPAALKTDDVEVYGHGRYLTVTGNALQHLPIGDGQALVSDLFAHYKPRPSTTPRLVPPSLGLDDEAIRALILESRAGERFTRLMAGKPEEGDATNIHDDSVVDFALAKILAFWCRAEYDQIERIMRTSKLVRPKWDETRGGRTYLRQTIEEAVSRTSTFYTPSGQSNEQEAAQQVERDFQHLQASAATWNFLTANPPKLDLYYGLFERGEVHVLSGCSTVGKSTRALWLAGHWVAGALPFTQADGVRAMGAASDDFQAPAKGLVLYVSPDAQQANLARTVKRLRERGKDYMGCDPKDFAAQNFFPLCRDDGDVQRFTHYKLFPEGWRGLAKLVGRLQASVCPDKPESVVPLVVLDTLARLSGKVNELDNHGLTELVERAEWLATQSGSVVLLLHHVAQADHFKKFKEIDPLTYGRGGTGTAAAARVSIAMAKVEDCGGRVLGEKVAANNQPPVAPRYFEVHADGGRGIDYFRPIPASEVEVLQKKHNKDGQPSYGEIYQALQQAQPGGSCTKTELREVVAKLCNASAKTDSTIELADAFVKHCLAAGSIRVEDLGANRERHTFTPLALPVSHPGD